MQACCGSAHDKINIINQCGEMKVFAGGYIIRIYYDVNVILLSEKRKQRTGPNTRYVMKVVKRVPHCVPLVIRSKSAEYI